jgi:glycosyltransferase involved in cell wall biosynthesis
MSDTLEFAGKTLLITGGTGTFGNAVLRRFLETDIAEIRVFSRDEKKQHDMRLAYNNRKLKFYIGDVRRAESLLDAMVGVDFVFHAAALKQVPSCESFGLPLAEAMVCGVPVVAANRSSLPEIVGDAGLLVDPDDVEEVADALNRVITDRAFASNLTERGRVQVQRFSWHRAAQQMIMIFDEIGNH